jgi:hypothetical protein
MTISAYRTAFCKLPEMIHLSVLPRLTNNHVTLSHLFLQGAPCRRSMSIQGAGCMIWHLQNQVRPCLLLQHITKTIDLIIRVCRRYQPWVFFTSCAGAASAMRDQPSRLCVFLIWFAVLGVLQ